MEWEPAGLDISWVKVDELCCPMAVPVDVLVLFRNVKENGR